MTMPGRDDERFEEVLERLDALVRRGQPDADLPPPPPPAVSEASIPVLTEIYRPGSAEAEPASGQPALPELSTAEKLEQAVAAALPVMTEVLEQVLAQTVRPALDQAIADLRPQMEAVLRQRLLQALAQEQGQTEM